MGQHMIKRKGVPIGSTWVRCSFGVFADNFTLDQISERLLLRPDGGGLIRSGIVEFSFAADGPVCSWVLRSRTDPRAPVSEHMCDLLERIEPRKSQLKQLIELGALVEMTVCILGAGFTIPFELPGELALRLSELGVRLTVYFTPEQRWFALAAHLDFDHE